jgi:hypothetical protein
MGTLKLLFTIEKPAHTIKLRERLALNWHRHNRMCYQ